MTKIEESKLGFLRRRFTIDIELETNPVVIITKCWKFVGFTLEESLDRCYKYIKESKVECDNDVIREYEEMKKYLKED